MLVNATNCCSFDAGEWSVVQDDYVISMVSPEGSAELRVTAYDYGRSVTLTELVQLAKNRAGESVEVMESNCGQYAGIAFRGVEDNLAYHTWYLTLAEILLDIELTCEDGNLDAHLKAAEAILVTLRDTRP
ncbi:hypothetical protein [Aeoliella sp.]|uniref:hypothetical protein n=1 Tax=Aeoliella sp. TaxID=2795800 RepID=UPI003CCC34FF